jgi:hypothetical protein
VHGADDEVAGLGRADRHLDRLEVAQLPDHDDVGVLAERALERREEGLGVLADLALRHVASLRPLDHLDRVLDRDDVVLAGLVEVGDHRGQRRRLAGADRARDEDEAVVVAQELLQRVEVGREPELRHRLDLLRHHPVGARRCPPCGT